MDGERWTRIERLLQEVLDTPLEQRDVSLRERCGDDEVLLREVQELVRAEERAGAFLSRPAMHVSASALAREQQEGAEAASDDRIGRTVSHYRIAERIGAGGMGVVYKAEDRRLRRFVALKFLTDQLAHESDALHRFQREARTASALSHPNICTIHDVGDEDGHAFIAMEYLKGSTLKARLAENGALDLATLLGLGQEIADALDAAHAVGIVHRDIKPANVFITDRRHAKVLDFGVATQSGVVAQSGAEQVPTSNGTASGLVPGTPGYMAPEQVAGEDVDHRADIWGLGLVLHEMATGMRPFTAGRLPLDRYPGLEHVVAKCLELDRNRRYQRASEVRAELHGLQQDREPTRVAGPSAGAARRKARWAWVAGVSGVAILALGVGGYVMRRSPAPLTQTDAIVLADFANATGDTVFDQTLRQGLAVQLGQSPFLTIVPDDRLRRTLQLMGQPPTAPLTDDVARDACVRTGGTVMVAGSIARLGSAYALGLRTQQCATGDLLEQDQIQAARKEDVLNVLSQLATRFRSRVGESLATVRQHSTPLEEASTPSLEALKAFSAASRAFDAPTAIPLLKRAVEIDANFAIAHSQLGFGYAARGQVVLGEESIRRAYELREHATDRDRFYIMTIYDRQLTGNLEKEGETLRLWAQSYPRDPVAPGILSGFYAAGTGRYEFMLEKAQEAIAIGNDFGQATPAYYNVPWALMGLGRVDAAEQALERAMARADSPAASTVGYHIAFLKGDVEGMQRQTMRAIGKPDREDRVANLQALMLARAGRLDEATLTERHAIDRASAEGNHERAGAYEATIAVWEGWYGNGAVARPRALHVVGERPGRHVTYACALALALAGDVTRSQAIADDLERRFPEDTSVRFNYLPTLRALAALNAKDPTRAIERLQLAATYEFGQPGISFDGIGGVGVGAMYPTYVRGLAYLAQRKGSDAAAEFQRIVDHPGVMLEDPVDALARLQLARAWAIAGDRSKAAAAYTDLLRLWTDADTAQPLIRAARAEYEGLH